MHQTMGEYVIRVYKYIDPQLSSCGEQFTIKHAHIYKATGKPINILYSCKFASS